MLLISKINESWTGIRLKDICMALECYRGSDQFELVNSSHFKYQIMVPNYTYSDAEQRGHENGPISSGEHRRGAHHLSKFVSAIMFVDLRISEDLPPGQG